MSARLAIAAAGLALCAIAGLPHGAAPPAKGVQLVAAHGPLAMLNTSDGGAIIAAHDMRPGSIATGSVTLVNRADSPARLYLEASPAHERRGPAGGSLATVLRLGLREAGGREIASGPADALTGCHDLGTIGAREARRYELSATFPRGGAGDNAYAGSAASIDLRWVEHAPEAGGCGPVLASTPAARAVLSHRRVALVHGRAVLRVRCRGQSGERCAGTVALERARGRSRLDRAAAFARGRFAMAAGRTATVRVRVAVGRRRKAIATAVLRSGGQVSRRRVTLIAR